MRKTVLSLVPVPVAELKLLIQRFPGVPDIEVVDGYNISREQLLKAFANADVVLGDYSFKHRIGSELVAKAGPLKLIQQPSAGYDNIDIEACSQRGIRVANRPTGNTAPLLSTPLPWHWLRCGSSFAPIAVCARVDGSG